VRGCAQFRRIVAIAPNPAESKSFLLLFFKKACPGLEPGKRFLAF
jgi:hypothetical protein